MTRINLPLILFVIIAAFVISCKDGNKNTEINKSDTLESLNTATTKLADVKFAYGNCLDLAKLWDSYKYNSDKNKLFTDSTFKTSLIELTPHEKVSLIFPFISKLLDVKDSTFVRDLQKAYFISKGKEIGAVTPITVLIWGDDYASITLLLIDKNNKPIDGINLFGGFEGGPVTQEDGMTLTLMPRRSVFKENEIIATEITYHDFPYSLNKPAFTNTVIIKSIITENGKIKTSTISKKNTHYLSAIIGVI